MLFIDTCIWTDLPELLIDIYIMLTTCIWIHSWELLIDTLFWFKFYPFWFQLYLDKSSMVTDNIEWLWPFLELNKNPNPHPTPTQRQTFSQLNHVWSSSNFQDIFFIIIQHDPWCQRWPHPSSLQSGTLNVLQASILCFLSLIMSDLDQTFRIGPLIMS